MTGLKIFLLLFAAVLISAVPAQIKIKAVGDVMPGSFTPKKIIPPDSGRVFINSIKPYLAGADLLFGNFEGTLISGWEKPCKCTENDTIKCYEFGVPVYLLPAVKKLGFTVMNLNNNHSADYGGNVYKLTKKYLNDNGIKTAGREGFADLTINNYKIAVIGFGNGKSENQLWNIKAAADKIRELKLKYNYVFVSFHGGKEGVSAVDMQDEIAAYKEKGSFSLINFAHAVIDAGADIVIGHGPHVLRPFELYNGKLIAYSLGNFLTYGNFSLKSYCGISGILEAELDKNGNFIKGRFIPTLQKGLGIPSYDNSCSSIKLMKKLMNDFRPGSRLNIDDSGNLFVKNK
jgi:hypothetical protein